MALDLATKNRIKDCWGAWRAAQGASCLGCGLPGHPALDAEVYYRVVRMTCRACGHAYFFSLGRLLGGYTPHVPAGRGTHIVRLDELTRALRNEIGVIADDNEPPLFIERRQYLDELQDGLAGLDAARVVLAGVVGRMERQAAAPAGTVGLLPGSHGRTRPGKRSPAAMKGQ